MPVLSENNEWLDNFIKHKEKPDEDAFDGIEVKINQICEEGGVKDQFNDNFKYFIKGIKGYKNKKKLHDEYTKRVFLKWT